MHVNIDLNIPSRDITNIIDENSRNVSSLQSTIKVGQNQF